MLLAEEKEMLIDTLTDQEENSYQCTVSRFSFGIHDPKIIYTFRLFSVHVQSMLCQVCTKPNCYYALLMIIIFV